MTIWFDVEDLIEFFQNATRPTGIQRLSFEIYRAIWHQAGASGEVRFCRRRARAGYHGIHFPALEAGITVTSETPLAAPSLPPPARPSDLAMAARRLPPQYRLPLGVMARSGRAMLGAARDLSLAALTPWRPHPPSNRVGGHQFELDGPDVAFGPGDWFVNLGASWNTKYTPEFITGLRAGGTNFALLSFDLIPEIFPEWCHHTVVDDFSAWLREVVPQTDVMFAISRNTAADLTSCLARLGQPLAQVPVVLPVGSRPPAPARISPPPPRPYILMVGTIEARKNHAAMLRVWRQLLATLPASEVPDLVIAGKTGWLTNDLMQQFENANWLGGKIRFHESPSESELAGLYQHCWFSIFPSFYEGWGLPVTESLSYGKTVAASNRASIPEAGGDLCVYFDPDNTTEIYNLIRGLIERPERIMALEARIAAQFHPFSWEDAATAVLARLGLEDPASCFEPADIRFASRA